MTRPRLLAALAAFGTAVTYLLGGWDGALKLLMLLMICDYLLGLGVAFWFHASPKTPGGRLSSAAGFRGLVKKCGVLVVVLIAAALDRTMGMQAARLPVIYFFAGNEGISILENLSLMGVPLPPVIENAFEIMKEAGEKPPTDEDKEGRA